MKNLLKKEHWSIPKLTEALKEQWTQELVIDCLQTLSDSMPRRLSIITEAKEEAIITKHFL